MRVIIDRGEAPAESHQDLHDAAVGGLFSGLLLARHACSRRPGKTLRRIVESVGIIDEISRSAPRLGSVFLA
jgi:hypothetical protein